MSANYVSSGLPDSDSDSEFGFDQTHGGVDGNDADLYGDLETNIFHRSDQPEYKSVGQLLQSGHMSLAYYALILSSSFNSYKRIFIAQTADGPRA